LVGRFKGWEGGRDKSFMDEREREKFLLTIEEGRKRERERE